MNATKFSMNTKLTDSQINDLARPLLGILEAFYQDPKNEKGFQEWLNSRRGNKENKAHDK